MVMDWTAADAEKAIKETVTRARTDLKFRELALKDPRAALRQVSGKEPPEGLRIKFFDGGDAHVTVVLPEYVSDASELSDAQLEQVAGGGRCAASCVASCAVSSTVSLGLPGVGAIGGCI
jgi:hypothetical protein